MTRPIRAILWDVDGTLLDFLAAERAAIRACFGALGLGECTDDMLARYSAVNRGYWAMIERGEIPKARALVARFEDFFAAEGLPPDRAGAFNAEYQVRLGDTVVFMDGAGEVVSALRGRVRQYAVTNGTRTAQRRKLKNSGLVDLLDGVFISDEIGAEKPERAFFDYVFSHIPEAPGETMIVGDSLTSDMRGGRAAGLRCCWFNPSGKPRDGADIDDDIRRLDEVPALVGGRCPAGRPYYNGFDGKR